jgi:general secretion pathway protein G
MVVSAPIPQKPIPLGRALANLGRLPRDQAGFTLLELMIVVAILAIIASVGVPNYISALRIARIGKARQELVTIAQAVDSFMANNGGQLPLTLHQAGFGNKRDPWGVPYCYLNYADGTGDGLDWAIDAGLVDPSAVKVAAADIPGARANAPRLASFGGIGDPRGEVGPDTRPGIEAREASLPGFARRFARGLAQDPMQVAPVEGGGRGAAATAVAAEVVSVVGREVTTAEREVLVSSLSRAGAVRIFAGVATETTRRRDRYMFPLNTDYDLFSLGPNGRTTVSLGESLGQDDVIRANNGGFFGTASEY